MNKGLKYKSILVISDLHFPFNHPDVVAFLRAIKNKYKPDKVISLGDEVDFHGINFHEHNPDLPSPGDELATAIRRLQPIYKLFPKMDLVESNHGSMVMRKAISSGLPRKVFKNYRDVLNAPKGWHWHDELIIYMSDGNPLYICHGKSADVLKLSQSMGMSCIQGHFHERFEVRYWGNKLGLYWGCIAGCLIENKSLAFAYNKLNLKRPVIGTVVIVEGHPKLIPMVLNKSGRWVGRL